MRKHDREKYELEHEALSLFLQLYNRTHRNCLSKTEKREMPDFLLRDQCGNQYGLEVAHLFTDHLQAMRLFGREGKKTSGRRQRETVLEKLNAQLKKKYEKWQNYNISFPCHLLIRIFSKELTAATIAHKQLYTAHNPYDKIWLLVHSSNEQEEWVLIEIG
ncbi:hypothetical protein [Bacillus sp. 165]|uniref:hypothetical protein n=1 Tax=Bacillus sp. 165 TaxID=1529117 RepID=UPI001ADB7904|nr:hypothetical protein [Bacillus sp. 165]MBO9130380.1 hypothetical protein [Bacillus sp. 165]